MFRSLTQRWRFPEMAACAVALACMACAGSPTDPQPPPPSAAPSAPPATPTPQPTQTPTPEPSPASACDRDREKPQVRIQRPGNNALIRSSSVDIEAAATDNEGVTRVEFYYHLDSEGFAGPGPAAVRGPVVYISEKHNPPYVVRWDVPRTCDARFSLYAWAYDACGNVGEANLVRVEVCN